MVLRHAFQQGARLANSEILEDLHSYLNHLTVNQKIDIVKLLSDLNLSVW